MTDWDDVDEWDDEDEPTSAYDPDTHNLRVLDAQCPTCIYLPGNLMHLNPGRLREMTEGGLQEGCQGVICHETLPGREDGFLPAVCGGFYLKYGPRNNCIRVMERINGVEKVTLPCTR
jgi:hypothetical protein